MKKLIMQISALFLLVFLTDMAIIVISGRDHSYFIAANIDKQEKLRGTSSPKIVFVGGSGLAFGLDSKLVEGAIKFPVVNMGLHAGVGLKYMIDEVMPYVNEGDVVVVVPEYDYFYGDIVYGNCQLIDMIVLYPENIRYLSARQYVPILRLIFENAQARFQNSIVKIVKGDKNRGYNNVYRRDGFNDYGDMVAHLDKESADVASMSLGIGGKFNEDTIRILVEAGNVLIDKKARLYFLYPAIPDLFYRKYNNNKSLQEVHKNLLNSFGVAVLGEPGEFIFPVEYFFDTPYHLNKAGRKARTEQLIGKLTKALETEYKN